MFAFVTDANMFFVTLRTSEHCERECVNWDHNVQTFFMSLDPFADVPVLLIVIPIVLRLIRSAGK